MMESTEADQIARMRLISRALTCYRGSPYDLFEIETWKQLIRDAIVGDLAKEEQFGQDDRLHQEAVSVIAQMSSEAYRHKVYQILVSIGGSSTRTAAVKRAQGFLALCDQYGLQNNPVPRPSQEDTDDPMDGSTVSAGNSDDDVLEDFRHKHKRTTIRNRDNPNLKDYKPISIPRTREGRRVFAVPHPTSLDLYFGQLAHGHGSFGMISDDLLAQENSRHQLHRLDVYEIKQGETFEAAILDLKTPTNPNPQPPLYGIIEQLTPVPTGLIIAPIPRYQGVGLNELMNREDYIATEESACKTGVDAPKTDSESEIPISDPPVEPNEIKEDFPKCWKDVTATYIRPTLSPPLKLFMFDRLREALSNPADTKIITAYELTIKQEDLAVYNNAEWLQDVNIDFYLEMIKERNNQPNSALPSVYVFRAFFYKLLEMNGYNFDLAREVLGTTNIFCFDLLFVPIHSENHWVLVTVDFKNKTMNCYDSMNRNNKDHLDLVGRFLLQEHLEKQVGVGDEQESDSSGSNGSGEPGGLEWKISDFGKGVIPQQSNCDDCGIFCLQFAEYVSRRRDFDFAQRNAPYFRARMMYETLTNTLLT